MNVVKRKTLRSTALIASLAAVWGTLSIGAVPPRRSPLDLATGRMLVATRQVGGPIFEQSIVLLTGYDRTAGAAGLIINRRSQHSLATLVPDLGAAKLAKSPIHLGGPVSPKTVQVAWRTDETPEGALRVLEDVHTSARATVLRQLIRADTPANEIRAYVGYSGWSPGQLENEIARGDWILIRGDPKLVFHAAPETLWPRLIGAHEGLQAALPSLPALPSPPALRWAPADSARPTSRARRGQPSDVRRRHLDLNLRQAAIDAVDLTGDIARRG